MAVTGLYIYDKNVFNYIRNITPSLRGELEITDVNNEYIRNNKLNHSTLDGFWSDAGTFQSLFQANSFWAKKLTPNNSQILIIYETFRYGWSRVYWL